MKRFGGLLLLAVAIPGTAQAQAYQCRIPEGPVSLPQPRRDGPVREVPITGYTLALSWSPEFCRFREDVAAHARQCAGRHGSFGFVVHGLWPEGRGTDWPQWCPATRQPPDATVRAAMCMSPDAALIAHEWAKHGSCMTADPSLYLLATRSLWNALRWPDFDRLSRRRDLTAGEVRTAFAEANPGWDNAMVGLVVNERGWLEEMRLCYDIVMQPEPCDRRRYGPADEAEVRIFSEL